MNLFEIASRKKYRFDTTKGNLTVEMLWDLPLQSATKVDLDTVAKTINNELKSINDESFVEASSNPRKSELETKLEIVKYIIKARQDENSAQQAASARKEEIRKMEELYARKKDQVLESKSMEEIEAELKKLKSAGA